MCLRARTPLTALAKWIDKTFEEGFIRVSILNQLFLCKICRMTRRFLNLSLHSSPVSSGKTMFRRMGYFLSNDNGLAFWPQGNFSSSN